MHLTTYTQTDPTTVSRTFLPGTRTRTFVMSKVMANRDSISSIDRVGSDPATKAALLAAQGVITLGEDGYKANERIVRKERSLFYVLAQGHVNARSDVMDLLQKLGVDTPIKGSPEADENFVELATRFVDWQSEPNMRTRTNTCTFRPWNWPKRGAHVN